MSRVLIIDDEEDVRRAVRRRLERDGYDVEEAGSAQEAFGKIKEARPPYDAIVTDMSMEDPHAGVQVLAAAFAQDVFAQVIVMTAYGNVSNAVECMRRGAFDYIEKNQPGVDAYETLTVKLAEALDQRRQDIQAVSRWERVARLKGA